MPDRIRFGTFKNKIDRYWRLLKFFIFSTGKRPDFTKEDLDLRELKHPKTGKVIIKIPVFTDIDPKVAIRNLWFFDTNEYMTLASYEFARRFPKHPYSEEIRKEKIPSDEVIKDMASGKKRFRIIEENGEDTFYIGK